MLSDRDITAQISARRILIDPPPEPGRLQPVSIDVTLAPRFRIFDAGALRMVRLSDIPDDLTTEIDGSDGLQLRPGAFVLASTAEHVTLPDDICGFLHGRSTLGRLGLAVHATAGLIDPGYSGQITLEISNVGELVLLLTPGDSIGQLTFEQVSSACQRPYNSPGLGSHYQGQVGPTPPRSGVVRPVEPVAGACAENVPGCTRKRRHQHTPISVRAGE